MPEKSNGSSWVSKQLIEFMLPRAQPFPVECLKMCLVCPSPVLPTHCVWRDVASDIGGFFHSGCFFSERSAQWVNFMLCFQLLPLRFKQRIYSLTGFYSELERTWNTVTCISSSYTGRKSSYVFVYFGLVCVVRLFKVEHSKQESSQGCVSNDFYSSSLRLYLEFWKICFFLVCFVRRGLSYGINYILWTMETI